MIPEENRQKNAWTEEIQVKFTFAIKSANDLSLLTSPKKEKEEEDISLLLLMLNSTYHPVKFTFVMQNKEENYYQEPVKGE